MTSQTKEFLRDVFLMAVIVLILMLIFTESANADTFKTTAYCACVVCCQQYADGHFASGKKVYVGGVANNWLPFGTTVLIDGLPYKVEDRGAKKYFGTRNNPIKAIDIYFDSHEQARSYGVQWREVEIL